MLSAVLICLSDDRLFYDSMNPSYQEQIILNLVPSNLLVLTQLSQAYYWCGVQCPCHHSPSQLLLVKAGEQGLTQQGPPPCSQCLNHFRLAIYFVIRSRTIVASLPKNRGWRKPRQGELEERGENGDAQNTNHDRSQ